MSDVTALGEAEIITYLAVKRVTGDIQYYRVTGGQNEEIDEATYLAEAGGE